MTKEELLKQISNLNEQLATIVAAETAVLATKREEQIREGRSKLLSMEKQIDFIFDQMCATAKEYTLYYNFEFASNDVSIAEDGTWESSAY